MKKKLLPAYVSGALVNLPFFVVITYLPNFMRQLGASNFQIGLLTTFYFLVSTFSSPFWGALSDLIKNRKLLAFGSVFSFAFLLFALSKAFTPLQVILIRGGIGLVFPAFTGPVLALISEHSTTQQRGGDISWYNAFLSLGRMIGLLIGSYLTHTFSLSYIFFLFSFFLLSTIVPVLFFPEKTFNIRLPDAHRFLSEVKGRLFPVKETGDSLLMEKGLIFLYVSLILRVICIVGFSSFLPLYLVEELGYSLAFIGVFNSVGAAIMIFSMLVAGHAADIVGRKYIILLGLLLSALTPLSYHFGKYFTFILWFGRCAHSFGYSLLISGMSAFVGDIARDREQGALMGWIRMSFSIGGIVGPTIMGSLLSSIGYSMAAYLMATFAFTGFFLTLIAVGETMSEENRHSLEIF